MKTVAIVTARMGSTRLPGKSMLPICGMPLIGRLLERLGRAKSLDQTVVAIPNTPDNAVLTTEVLKNYSVYLGSERDVLDRVYYAAKDFDAERIVLVTGDCPLIDPELVDQTVAFFEKGGYDFVTNGDPPTWPDGLDTAVFTMQLLEQAWMHADTPAEREHVTLWMKKGGHPSLAFDQPPYPFCGALMGTPDRSHLRWCVDEQKDLELVRWIYQTLLPVNPHFTTQQIIELLARNPGLSFINAGIPRNAGLTKSLGEQR